VNLIRCYISSAAPKGYNFVMLSSFESTDFEPQLIVGYTNSVYQRDFRFELQPERRWLGLANTELLVPTSQCTPPEVGGLQQRVPANHLPTGRFVDVAEEVRLRLGRA